MLEVKASGVDGQAIGQTPVSSAGEICPGLHANAKIAILAKNRKNRRTPKS